MDYLTGTSFASKLLVDTEELKMRPIRYFLAILLLVFSGQSLAFFMPEGVHANTVTAKVMNDAGC